MKAVAVDLQVGISPINKKSDAEIAEACINAMKWDSAVPDEKIRLHAVAKNVQFGSIMGMHVFADLPYLFIVDFTDGEMRMTFTLGDENGDITNGNGEVIASTSPSHMFNKKGEVLKMSKILKIEAEKTMNDISNALVAYVLN